MYSLPSNTCADGSAVYMCVTSGCDIACPASVFRISRSMSAISSRVRDTGSRQRRSAAAARAEVALDARFHRLVDFVAEQQGDAEQERDRAVHADRQLDAVYDFRRLRGQAGLVAVG